MSASQADLRLRPPHIKEAYALAGLHAACFETPWSADTFVELIQSPGVISVAAARGEQLLGVLVARVAADEAELITVAVAPQAQRAGIGRALVQTACSLAAAAGAQRMFLEVAVENLAAAALYRALSFQAVGLRRGYYERPGGRAMDAAVLRRDLTA